MSTSMVTSNVAGKRYSVAVAIVVAVIVVASLALGPKISGTAHASIPCQNHAYATNCDSLYGSLTIQCNGSTVRYATSQNSASHGNPATGTYTKWLPNRGGDWVDGSTYCMGISNNTWLLASSGWISRTLAF